MSAFLDKPALFLHNVTKSISTCSFNFDITRNILHPAAMTSTFSRVVNDPPRTPPSCSTKNTIDTPPHTPNTAEFPTSVVDAETVGDTCGNAATEQVQVSSKADAEDVGACDGGDRHGQSPTVQADPGRKNVEGDVTIEDHVIVQALRTSTPDAPPPVTAIKQETKDEQCLSADDKTPEVHAEPASDIEPCEVRPVQSILIQAPTATECEVPGTLGVASNKSQQNQARITQHVPTDNKTGKDEDGREPYDSSLRDDKQGTIDIGDKAESVPPHLRSTFKAPNMPGLVESRCDWPAPVLRTSRVHYPAATYAPSRSPIDYDELRRSKSQLMKARDELEAERKVNAEMRKTVGSEAQASVSAAMAEMLSNLLQKQAETLMAKAKTQEKERELQYREQQIKQLEVYLSEGQKQLHHQLEQQGIRLMSAVDEAKLRREVELKVKHQLFDVEGKIAIQVERLRHQEAAQKVREQQYKVLVRDALEAEVRQKLGQEMQATKAANSKAIEAAYERGFAEGKKGGDAVTPSTASKNEYLKGYAACYRSQSALHKMRKGRLASDSPELAFLYDPTHSENPHNMGLSIGLMEAGSASSSVGVVVVRSSTTEGAVRANITTNGSQSISSAVSSCGRGPAQSDNTGPSHSSSTEEHSKPLGPVQQTRQQPVQQEKPLKTVPPRATFAGELRSYSTAAANGVSTSKLAQQSVSNTPQTPVAAANNVHKASLTGRVGEGVYAGRRTVRYEDSEDESASPNLIDLY